MPESDKPHIGTPGGFGAGVGAAAIMLVVMFIERLGANTRSIPELIEDPLTQLTGGQTESFFIDLIGVGGKGLLLASIAEGTLLLGGLIGWAFARFWLLRQPGALARWGSGVLLGLILGLSLNVVVLPLFGQGFFGGKAPLSTAQVNFAQALYGTQLAPIGLPVWLNMWLLSLIFTVVLMALLPWPRVIAAEADDKSDAKPALSRREFGKVAGGAALALLGGAGIYGLSNLLQAAPPVAEPQPAAPDGAAPGATPLPAEFAGAQPQLVPAITPVENFYITTKNYIDPVVDGDAWRLTFGGLVNNPFTLTLADLRALPTMERDETLTCISNGVGGQLISNAHWRGVSFADLITRAGPQAGVVDVALRAAEGYTDNLPLDVALHDDCMLAYEMNGQPLPVKHGFPARLLVPNLYGLKNCKWLTAVELVNYDSKGYWQDRGWTDNGQINTMSRIDYPCDERIPAKPLYISGVAFAGNRGVKRVEVSTDGGQSWHDASLRPSSNNISWVQWTYPWAPSVGSYTLVVRATDNSGVLQTNVEQDTFPTGATGYHRVKVKVG